MAGGADEGFYLRAVSDKIPFAHWKDSWQWRRNWNGARRRPGFEARDAGEKTVTALVAISMKGDGIRRTGRPVGWFQ